MTVHRLPLMSPADASALLADLGYRETMTFAEVRAIGETLSAAERKAFLDALRISARAASREADALEAEIGQRRERERPAKRGGDRAMTLFEQERGRLTWRLEATQWNGEPRVQVWPWYRPKDGGELRPCAERYGGGFAIPLDRVPELIAALATVAPGEG